MSSMDLQFENGLTGTIIYDPLILEGSAVLTVPVVAQVSVTNLGSDDLSQVGLYIIPASNQGDVDNPANNPPETDYQDLLTWGTASAATPAVEGGLKISSAVLASDTYITRSAGASRRSRLRLGNIVSGDTIDLTITFEAPPAVPARRLFISFIVGE